jgi:hypothetical protein
MLTHEINNFTMLEAIKFYPQLKDAFKVRCAQFLNTLSDDPTPLTVHRASWSGLEQNATICRGELYVAYIRAM